MFNFSLLFKNKKFQKHLLGFLFWEQLLKVLKICIASSHAVSCETKVQKKIFSPKDQSSQLQIFFLRIKRIAMSIKRVKNFYLPKFYFPVFLLSLFHELAYYCRLLMETNLKFKWRKVEEQRSFFLKNVLFFFSLPSCFHLFVCLFLCKAKNQEKIVAQFCILCWSTLKAIFYMSSSRMIFNPA